MIWTTENIEELMRLWRDGKTTYEIADHFRVTRNTICGKLHREKIKRGLMEAKPRIRDRRKAANTGTVPKRTYTRRKPVLSLPVRAGSVSSYVSEPTASPDRGQLASIVDVTGCRWPVKDDPDFTGGVAFCNHAQADHSPYCAYHKQVSVAPYSRKLINKTLGALGLRYRKAAA